MVTDTSKQCTLTNNSGTDILVVLDINADETASSGAIASASGQFEMLRTTSGHTLIKNNSADTVTLDHYYKDATNSNEYVQAYDLVASESTWVYPIATLPVQQQTTDGAANGYADQTLTADKLTAMRQAVTFYQTVSACPDTQLAKNYATALQAAKDAALAKADGSAGSAQAVADAISDTMNQFFQSTQDYKEVRLADVVAVDTYYNSLPAVWADYQESMTYYLYGSDGTTNSSFAGTLTLQKPGALDITKPGGGYNCTFTPAVDPSNTDNTDVDTTKAVTLSYVNGLFTDDPAADKPSIALQGSFMLKSRFTPDEADNKVITVVAGSVNGVSYVGLPQESSDDAGAGGFPAFWDRLTHPEDKKDWIISILILVGTVLLIPATAFGIYRVYKAATRKAPRRKGVFDDDVYSDTEPGKWKQTTRKWLDYTVWEKVLTHQLSPVESAGIADLISNGKTLLTGLSAQQEYVQKLMEYKALMKADDSLRLETLISNIHDSQVKIADAISKEVYQEPDTLAGRIKILKEEMAVFDETSGDIDKAFAKIAAQTLNDYELHEYIGKRVGAMIKCQAALEEALKEQENEEEEADPDIDSEIIPKVVGAD